MCVCVCVYTTPLHRQDETQSQFLKQILTGQSFLSSTGWNNKIVPIEKMS